MRGSSQRFAIIALGIITIILIGVSVFIAFRLQSEQAPDDISASEGSCVGGGSDDCGYGGRVNCGGRSESNCNAVAASGCNCSWQASTGTTTTGGSTGTTTTGGSTTSSGDSCPIRSTGQSCNAPSCGANRCDGGGPLGCNTCPSGTSKAGQQLCVNASTDDRYGGPQAATDRLFSACGGTTSSSTGSSTTTTTGSTGTGSTGEGETCTPGNNECSGNFICTQTALGSGVYKCNDPGDTSACSANAVCGGNGGYIGFKCDSLDAQGRCTRNSATRNSFAAAASYAGGCGQADTVWVGGSCNRQLCGDFQIYNNTCSGGSTNTTTTTTTGTTTTTQTTTYNCNNSFQCVAVNGSGGQYSSLGSCNNNCIDTPDPICGDSCSNDNDCSQGHFCSATGICTLNNCTDSTCLNGCSPLCGGPCDPSDANSCPQDHTCNANTNTCRLNVCNQAGVDCANGCTVIPDTALFDGQDNNLLSGLILIVLAIILIRFNVIGKLNIAVSNNRSYLSGGSEEEKRTRKVKKDRNDFEDRFDS